MMSFWNSPGQEEDVDFSCDLFATIVLRFISYLMYVSACLHVYLHTRRWHQIPQDSSYREL